MDGWSALAVRASRLFLTCRLRAVLRWRGRSLAWTQNVKEGTPVGHLNMESWKIKSRAVAGKHQHIMFESEFRIDY